MTNIVGISNDAVQPVQNEIYAMIIGNGTGNIANQYEWREVYWDSDYLRFQKIPDSEPGRGSLKTSYETQKNKDLIWYPAIESNGARQISPGTIVRLRKGNEFINPEETDENLLMNQYYIFDDKSPQFTNWTSLEWVVPRGCTGNTETSEQIWLRVSGVDIFTSETGYFYPIADPTTSFPSAWCPKVAEGIISKNPYSSMSTYDTETHLLSTSYNEAIWNNGYVSENRIAAEEPLAKETRGVWQITKTCAETLAEAEVATGTFYPGMESVCKLYFHGAELLTDPDNAGSPKWKVIVNNNSIKTYESGVRFPISWNPLVYQWSPVISEQGLNIGLYDGCLTGNAVGVTGFRSYSQLEFARGLSGTIPTGSTGLIRIGLWQDIYSTSYSFESATESCLSNPIKASWMAFTQGIGVKSTGCGAIIGITGLVTIPVVTGMRWTNGNCAIEYDVLDVTIMGSGNLRSIKAWQI